MKKLECIKQNDLLDVNGGGVGGFIVGCLAGSTVGLIGAPIVALTGGTQEDVEEFFLSSIVTGGAVGAMFTGPV